MKNLTQDLKRELVNYLKSEYTLEEVYEQLFMADISWKPKAWVEIEYNNGTTEILQLDKNNKIIN